MKKTAQLGFTLVELLVVVTIIIILATIGVTLYTNATTSAKKAKVIADVDSIAKALEANYNPDSGSYSALTTASFAKEPKKPDGTTYAYPAAGATYNICYDLTTGVSGCSEGTSCRCIKSSQNDSAASAPLTCPNFKGGTVTTQSCRYSCNDSPPATINVKCASFATNFDCSRTGCQPAYGPVAYTTSSGTTGSTTFYASDCACGPTTVNLVP